MRRFWFILSEAFRSLGRAKLSAFFSIVMVALAFTLLGIFYITSLQAERFLNYLKEKVEIEAFLSDSLTSDQIRNIESKILAMHGVKSVKFVSKEDAAEIFRHEFGQDIKAVLVFNPLPASFKIFLDDHSKNLSDVERIVSNVSKIGGVESVKYRKILLSLLDKRVRVFYGVVSGFGGALILLSVFLVYNSIRLAISHRKRIIEAMKLVGASRSFVRMPFLFGGIIQGLTGGVVASIIIYGLMKVGVELLQEDFFRQAMPPIGFYAAIVCIAAMLGLFSTLFATRRYIKENLA
jgi:cell division transport system permease protein